jgi:hypothetical protein
MNRDSQAPKNDGDEITPTERTYTFTWSYDRAEVVQLSLEIEQLNPAAVDNIKRARSNYILGMVVAGFFVTVGVLIFAYGFFFAAPIVFIWWTYVVPFAVAGLIYFESARLYRPYSKTKIARRHENFADYFMSIFENAPVTATLSAERITVGTTISDRSTRWIGAAGFFVTPSAFLITSSLNEWLLCLPRSVLNQADADRLASDLKRWFDQGQRQRLLAFLRNAPVACPKCSYNLKGISELTCPECGLALDPAAILR